MWLLGSKYCAFKPAGSDSGGISGFFDNVSNVISGLVGAAQNFGDLLDTVTRALTDSETCSASLEHERWRCQR